MFALVTFDQRLCMLCWRLPWTERAYVALATWPYVDSIFVLVVNEPEQQKIILLFLQPHFIDVNILNFYSYEVVS